MSNIIYKEKMIPLDDDGFLRRECPYCCREFKIERKDFESLDINQEYHCPFCGETTSPHFWLTKGQKNLFDKVVGNIAIDIINRDLIKFMKELNDPSKGITITAHDLERNNELINPEINDMQIIELPCCQKRIKIDKTRNSQIYCYYCGFLHNIA